MDELEKIHAQIAELQKKADELAQAKRQPVLDELKAKIKLYNFTPSELGFLPENKFKVVPSSEPKVGNKVAPKYAQGDNTWTGRGRKPKWVQDHLDKGGLIDDLLIK